MCEEILKAGFDMGNAQVQEFDEDSDDFVDELKPGTQLMHGQFTIERFLNAGGFGITYLAKDSLDRKIVIKECFPGAFCRRSNVIVAARSRAHQTELKSIVRHFVQEAKSLAKLDHPNIVGVHQVFEDNDTAYMALDFVEGKDLLDMLEDPDTSLTPAEVKSIVTDVLGAVGFIHDQGILHRDISPDNILIDADMRPVLIDFGAAREEVASEGRVLSALRVVKDGYSPQEFYIAGSDQNPSSDLYALGASFYHVITGATPPNAQARLAAIASGAEDPYVPLLGQVEGFDDNFLKAMDKSLEVLPKNRVQSAQDWISMMNGVAVAAPAGAAPAVEKAVAATAPALESKSKVGVLMASAAVIALVGVGVVTQTDIMGGGTAPAPVIAEPAVVTPIDGGRVVSVQQFAATRIEADRQAAQTIAAAQATEEARAATQALAAAEAQAEAQAREVAVALAAAEADAQTAAAALAAAEAKAASEAEARAVAEATAAAETEARLIAEAQAAEEAGARREAEAAATAASEARVIAEAKAEAGAAAAVIAQAAAEAAALAAATPDTPLPPLDRTAANLNAVASATSPGVSVEAPLDLAALSEAANLVGEAGSLAADAIVLPSVEIQYEAVVLPFNEGIPAFAPGNVIEEAPVAAANAIAATTLSESFILSAWSVDLPFAATSSRSNVIETVSTVAPVWVTPGITIETVNGEPITAISQINSVLRENVSLTGETELAVEFGVLDDRTRALVDKRWVVPIVQQTALLNGVGFETRLVDDVWQTTVISAPEDAAGELQVGDQIIAYMATSERLEGRTSLKDIMDREITAGTSQFSFAVQREGSMWIASLDYANNVQQ